MLDSDWTVALILIKVPATAMFTYEKEHINAYATAFLVTTPTRKVSPLTVLQNNRRERCSFKFPGRRKS